MKMQYKDVKTVEKAKLERLFLSVGWSSGHFPDKLALAIEHSDTVYTAWDGDRLAGLINALDDSVMTAYVHYLLVDPEYQKMGIGQELVRLLKEKYAEYMRIVLVAYENGRRFYENCGFQVSDGALPMYITSLWT